NSGSEVAGDGATATIDTSSPDSHPNASADDATREFEVSAASTDHLGEQLTHVGAIIGTPRYMAPEQHTGRELDERTDQFRFCVALYLALYDELPFAGAGGYRANVLAGRIAKPRASARVPGWLRDVLLRGLSVDPSARFASMTDLLAALRADP